MLLLSLITALNIFPQNGRIVRETVHGVSLEKNVTGDSPDRSVFVYLPPGYDKSPNKKYPVVYLLHGIGDSNEVWIREWRKDTAGYGTIPALMDKGIAEGRFGEMIVVMPDELTKGFGSFYVNSSATGNWADLTAMTRPGYGPGIPGWAAGG